MLVNEAILLSGILDRLAPSSILDLGSGSRADREIVQPHIGAAFRGHNVTWADMNPSPGVMYCDITDQRTLEDLPRCEMLTACSILEHVTDIDAAIASLRALMDRWMVVAVPLSYPIHHCPIDNGWRPTAQELAERLYSAGLTVNESYETEPENFYGVPDARATIVVAERTHCSSR